MNHPSHGLFADIVSFIKLFGNESYIERNKTMSELYIYYKIGYGTNADSLVGTPFKNVFPSPYGKVSTGSTDADVTAQVEFPGLTILEKWDVRNERSGRKYCIKYETHKTEVQLDNWMRTQLTGLDQVLAHNLLHDSHTVSHASYTFIRNSYEDTMHSGKFDSTQAWKLTS